MKGINPHSFKKHELVEQVVRMQTARARNFLRRDDRALVIDMHAGDAAGIKMDQPDFFRGAESRATPFIAIDAAARLRKLGVLCDVVLYEKSPAARADLASRLNGELVYLRGNHRSLLRWDTRRFKLYDFALVLNDPNGPAGHGDEMLELLARQVPKADFVIIVNQSACERINGVPGFSTNPDAPAWARSPEAAEAVHRKHSWRLNPLEWARRLHRRTVLEANRTVGIGAMKGRVLLVTNAPPERTPQNFARHDIATRHR
jgi:hypothetical protein